MRAAVFLDFDGVVVDSIRECYIVSRDAYYGMSGTSHEKLVENWFYKYRGLVRPPHHYCAIHQVIEKVISEEKDVNAIRFANLFQQAVVATESQRGKFESIFFALRHYNQEQKDYWFSLNPLTGYGKTLVNQKFPNYFIVTTKDEHSVRMLLEYYGISVAEIYSKDDYEQYGNKGVIIDRVMNCNPQFEKGVFIDDAVEHLDTVNNPKVDCYFADWGYGINNGYEIFRPEDWKKYL
ncbi:MAG: hypothetical protein GXP14_11100 [Gammaproteobacteria bacterium]|nr:hypothetical protein [Gammaproteobacteria bacterium]